MKKIFAVVPVVLTVLVAIGAPRTASADDAPGVDPTPCEETYDGAAQGLCIAFCEARDCDAVLQSNPNDAICTKVRFKFYGITGVDLYKSCPKPKIIK